MNRAIRLLHAVGMTLFLGSIFAFVVASTVIENADLATLAAGRRIIATGTDMLTVPGLGILLASGLWMGLRGYGLRSRFFQIKLGIGVLVLVNAALLVVPNVHAATQWAIRSLADGNLHSEFGLAYGRETIFGIVNVVLAFAAAVVGIWRVGAAQGAVRADPKTQDGF